MKEEAGKKISEVKDKVSEKTHHIKRKILYLGVGLAASMLARRFRRGK